MHRTSEGMIPVVVTRISEAFWVRRRTNANKVIGQIIVVSFILLFHVAQDSAALRHPADPSAAAGMVDAKQANEGQRKPNNGFAIGAEGLVRLRCQQLR